MSDDATNGGARAFSECRGRGFFIRGLAQPHLDELMARKCLVERANKRIAQAAFSYEDDRFQRMSQSAQVAALGSVEDGRSGG